MKTLPAPTPGTRVRKVLPVSDPPLIFPDVVWTREEKFHYVADLIESLPPEHFNLNYWFYIPYPMTVGAHGSEPVSVQTTGPQELLHTCGTTGCIAGWISADQIHPAFTFMYDSEAEQFAGQWLGLSSSEGYDLFANVYFWGKALNRRVERLEDVSQEEVVFVLREIAEDQIQL